MFSMFVIDPATNTFNDSLANSINSLYISIKKLFNCIYNDTSYIENIKYKFVEDDFINESDINDIEIFIKNKLLDKINMLLLSYDHLMETELITIPESVANEIEEIKNKVYKKDVKKVRKGWNKYDDVDIITIDYFH